MVNFKINGHIWSLEFVSPTNPILYVGNGKYTYGVTIPEWQSIYIADDVGGKFLKNIIAHELSHAEFAARGVKVPSYIEEVLADIISDNITDVSYLTNGLCKYYKKC